MTIAMKRVCDQLVAECTAVREGEICLLMKDLETTLLHRSLESAIHRAGGIPVVLSLPADIYRAATRPKWLEATLRSACVVFLCTKEFFPHASRNQAAQAGARVLSLGRVTDEMAERSLDVDHLQLSLVTHAVADQLGHASQVHITTDAGTDLHIEIRGQPTFFFDGLARDRGSVSVVPAGVVATLPIPRSSAGRVVLDASIGSVGLLDEPVVLDIRSGKITEISGGRAAETLRRILEQSDDESRNLCEVGLGTNSKATYVGDMVEDERVRGSAHIGLGANVQLGGTIKSSIHVDAAMRKPSVWLDEELIAADGDLLAA